MVIDFRSAPDVVYLENIIAQDNGRGPDDAKVPGRPVLKFIVAGPPAADDATVDVVSYRTAMNPYLKRRIDTEAIYV